MRDRLIKIVRESLVKNIDYTHRLVENITDDLLANGVIVLPEKPLPLIDEGDRVLCPICETDLMGCYFGYEENPTVVTCYGCGAWIDSTKAVEREEAKRALEGSENENNL